MSQLTKEYDLMKKKITSEEGTSNDTILILNAESLDYERCEKIFFLLRHALTLQTIILKSKGHHKVNYRVSNSEEAKAYKGSPVFFTKFAINTSYHAITDYLYNSDRIKVLAFKNIPIIGDLPILCQGIRNNKSVRVLQFEDCEIGDGGCIQLCQALRKSPIESFGLENCQVTQAGASWLAWLIREQSMLRMLTTWNKFKDDYEYKTKHGIRKFILNDNPGIHDSGAKFIVSTLFDDNWIKLIHMQNTGLSDVSCNLIQHLLDQNRTIVTFDIDRNFDVSNNLMISITEKLAKPSIDIEYPFKKHLRNKQKNSVKKVKKISTEELILEKSHNT